MPEKVCLTPVPAQEIIFMAANTIDGMNVRSVRVVHHNVAFADEEKLTPGTFAKLFSIQFMSRLMNWRNHALSRILHGIEHRVTVGKNENK